jgi:hypothetical protein
MRLTNLRIGLQAVGEGVWPVATDFNATFNAGKC